MAGTTPHLRTVSDSDGAAILDIERGLVSTLNATGAFVWERMQQGMDVNSIATELADRAGVDIETVTQDVKEFIHNLSSVHLNESVQKA